MDVFGIGAGIAFAGVGIGAFVLLVSAAVDIFRTTSHNHKQELEELRREP